MKKDLIYFSTDYRNFDNVSNLSSTIYIKEQKQIEIVNIVYYYIKKLTKPQLIQKH